MESPEVEPTPVKVINAAVLSCLDDMFFRLPFPSQTELEKLIKDAKGEAEMIEFKAKLREDLTNPRVLKDFESGWDKYWGETQSQKRTAASRGQPAKSMRDRFRSESPSDDGGADKGENESPSSQQVQ
jgi:hypothetical protein